MIAACARWATASERNLRLASWTLYALLTWLVVAP
jgi:hypothetical protein